MKKSYQPTAPLTAQQWADYETFVARNKTAFRRIAYRTAGEHDHHDVEHEALEVALRLRDKHGMEINFMDNEFQSTVIRHLYQHLVAYADKKVRFGTRLDHGIGEDEDMPHPLANILASNEGRNTLDLLIEREEASGPVFDPGRHPSLAAAYYRLLDHFNSHMFSVANHLLLSISHTYKRVAHARLLAAHQNALMLSPPGDSFLPGPWRKFKLYRPPEQLTLDLGEQCTMCIDSGT